MSIDLKAIFGTFAGREIPMVEEPYELELPNLGITHKGVLVRPLDPNDSTLADMKKAAEDNGLTLRLWWPGAGGDMSKKIRHVNAYIEKDSLGKWCVSNRFDTG
jgi:hypothetical protein